MGKLLKALLILALASAATGGVYAWSRGGKAEASGLTLVDPEKGAITEKAVAVGQIQPRQKFQVKSKISGIVKACMAEVGDTVKAGDPLFEIVPDPTPLETMEADRQVETAQATFDRAEADFQRFEELNKKGIVPAAELTRARESYELAKIALLKARQDRELTMKGRLSEGGNRLESIIRAPAAGTVLNRSVNPGDPVVPLTSYQPGTELATVADMGQLIFKGTVDEIDVGKLRTGLTARLKVGALPSDVVTGTVARIAPQATQKEGATLFDVEIELDASAGVTLRAGYSANADIVIREKKDILMIPERLVSFEDGGKKAFVELAPATPEGTPQKVAVELGISDGMNVEVIKGIEPGQKLVQRPPREIS